MHIKRTLFKELAAHLSQKEISLIIGPRQAGKTTLMFLLRDYLERRGQKTLFLNLDIEADKKYFVSQENLINKIKLEIGKEGVVFIDEIQRKEDAGVFLKGIYDMNLSYKFVVSGSGSVELKEKIHESLLGRKRLFEFTTLTFQEFVNFRTAYEYEDRLADFFSIENEKTIDLLKEYLNFGGYPRVVLAETVQEKRKVIDEIYQSYIEKDINYLLGVRKTEAFSNLVKMLAAQIGNLVNYSELSLSLGISAKKVKDYIWYLEKTFILERVTPYFKNLRKEISKSPVIYFHDLGLRNYSLGLFGNIDDPHSTGLVFQNFVFNLLKQQLRISPAKIHFWRTKDGGEVDFIVDATTNPIPIEVKYQAHKRLIFPRSLRNFIERYQPQNAFVVNLSLEETAVFGKTTIKSTPFYKLIADSIALG